MSADDGKSAVNQRLLVPRTSNELLQFMEEFRDLFDAAVQHFHFVHDVVSKLSTFYIAIMVEISSSDGDIYA